MDHAVKLYERLTSQTVRVTSEYRESHISIVITLRLLANLLRKLSNENSKSVCEILTCISQMNVLLKDSIRILFYAKHFMWTCCVFDKKMFHSDPLLNFLQYCWRIQYKLKISDFRYLTWWSVFFFYVMRIIVFFNITENYVLFTLVTIVLLCYTAETGIWY